MTKVRACYEFGRADLVRNGALSEVDAAKWKQIDDRLLSLQEDTKELLWHSRRRISREYASSSEGLGKYPADN